MPQMEVLSARLPKFLKTAQISTAQTKSFVSKVNMLDDIIAIVEIHRRRWHRHDIVAKVVLMWHSLNNFVVSGALVLIQRGME